MKILEFIKEMDPMSILFHAAAYLMLYGIFTIIFEDLAIIALIIIVVVELIFMLWSNKMRH